MQPSSSNLQSSAKAKTTGDPVASLAEAPLMEVYDVDILRVLPQDAVHLFIYWEVRQATLDAAYSLFGQASAAKQELALRLIDLTNGHEDSFDVGPIGSSWWNVLPGKTYKVELGLRLPEYGFIRLLNSNLVQMPVPMVAQETDPDPLYRTEPEEALRIYKASGLRLNEVLRIAAGDGPQTAGELTKTLENVPEPIQEALEQIATGYFDPSDDDMPPLWIEALVQFGQDLARESAEDSGGLGLAQYLENVIEQLTIDPELAHNPADLESPGTLSANTGGMNSNQFHSSDLYYSSADLVKFKR